MINVLIQRLAESVMKPSLSRTSLNKGYLTKIKPRANPILGLGFARLYFVCILLGFANKKCLPWKNKVSDFIL
jgi:hypothetical protein